MMPDETTIHCTRCSAYNIGDECCICKDCMEKIIDGWCGYSDYANSEEIKDLKERLGITVSTGKLKND